MRKGSVCFLAAAVWLALFGLTSGIPIENVRSEVMTQLHLSTRAAIEVTASGQTIESKDMKEIRTPPTMFSQSTVGTTPTATILLGTPPKPLLVILDTGSDILLAKTWMSIQNEVKQVDAGLKDKLLPTDDLYNSAASSSYIAGVMPSGQRKQGFIMYGSGMATTIVGNDTIRFAGSAMLQNFSISEITQDSLHMLHDESGVSGVLGLQHMKDSSHGTSLFTRARADNLITAFGYCCAQDAQSGTFFWGDTSAEGKVIPVIGSIHWAVALTNVTFVEQVAQPEEEGIEDSFKPKELFEENATIPRAFCADSPCIVVIDTGSNIIAMPKSTLKALTRNLSVKPDCSNVKDLPTLTLILNDFQVKLPPEAYLMKIQLPSQVGTQGSLASVSENGVLNGDASTIEAATDFKQVDEMFDEINRLYHLDMKEALRHAKPESQTLNTSTFCVSSFVSLDANTKAGPLWILGTPLFQQYYTRWSWPRAASSPSIFLQPMAESTTCKPAAPAPPPAPMMTVLLSDAPHRATAKLLRSESEGRRDGRVGDGRDLENEALVSKLRTMRVEDIRYPSWALNLEEV